MKAFQANMLIFVSVGTSEARRCGGFGLGQPAGGERCRRLSPGLPVYLRLSLLAGTLNFLQLSPLTIVCYPNLFCPPPFFLCCPLRVKNGDK